MVKQTTMRHPESHSMAPARWLVLAFLAAAAWLSGCSFEPTTVGLCMTDAHCSGGQVCNVAENVCVQICRQHSECTETNRPICNIETGLCRRCEGSADCMDLDPVRSVCTAGMCVEPERRYCGDSSECTTDLPMCDGTECVACSPDAAGDEACDIHYSDKPLCTEASICGECRNDSHCTTEEPVCNVDTGACRACQANSECESNVCDKLSGQCAAPADVLYVDGTDGMDGDTCGDSGGTPCKTIDVALTRVEADFPRFIRIEQGVYPQVLSISGKQVTLVGDEATIQPAVSGEDNSPVITADSGATLTIQGVTVQKAGGGSNADGIECIGPNTSLRLIETTVTDNDARGVDSSTQCTLTIERSTVSNNGGGGIVVSNAGFSITNSFIVVNGNAAISQIGGAKIENTNDYTPQVFSFNTVVRNQALSAADASGTRCSTSTSMTASNNIVYGGVGGAASVSGLCAWAYSNIQGGVAGTGNIDADPMFKDFANGDFHIKPGSPCEDAADPAATTPFDFDGDPRPSGDAPDMGADELVPAPMQ